MARRRRPRGPAFGFVLARLAGRYFLDVKMPGALPVFASAFVLSGPGNSRRCCGRHAPRRVDVMQALRSEYRRTLRSGLPGNFEPLLWLLLRPGTSPRSPA